jgi:hypothetical protein
MIIFNYRNKINKKELINPTKINESDKFNV